MFVIWDKGKQSLYCKDLPVESLYVVWWQKEENPVYRDNTENTWFGSLLFKVLKRYYNGGSVAGNTLTTEMLFSMSPAVYLLVPLAKLHMDSMAYCLL